MRDSPGEAVGWWCASGLRYGLPTTGMLEALPSSWSSGWLRAGSSRGVGFTQGCCKEGVMHTRCLHADTILAASPIS